MNQTHDCPICPVKIEHQERYPNQVCQDCSERIADENGRGIILELNWSGGHSAIYKDNGDRYLQQFIYIDGVKCEAAEDRFGRGIVIQTVEK